MNELERAVALLRDGGVGVYPTDTIAGLGGDASRDEVLTRIAALKRRPADKRFPLLLPRSLPLSDVAVVTPAAERLAQVFWPGGVTLVVTAAPGVPTAWCAEDGTIAVRRSAHPVAAFLADQLGSPLVATSANRAGEPAPPTVADADPELLAEVDFALGDETATPSTPLATPPLVPGVGSTIVLVTAAAGVRVLRHGAVPEEHIWAAFNGFGG
jgi:L-threonylcarbamoyladenylate synthase